MEFPKAHPRFVIATWPPFGIDNFHVQAEKLTAQREEARRAGFLGGQVMDCKIGQVVDFFAKYINEWNPNKTSTGEEEVSHVAERVNETTPHTASLSEAEMLDLLRDDNAAALLDYYKRAVRTEHIHDFHYPDPLGPPNPSQPCAQLLKGTTNMWYCKNGYPRDLISDPMEQSVAQDALRPELWRCNLCRNCPLMNSHIPMVTIGTQSNTDAAGVVTRHQAEMYCCKYCSKHGKRVGQRNVLYEVMEDLERKDNAAWGKL